MKAIHRRAVVVVIGIVIVIVVGAVVIIVVVIVIVIVIASILSISRRFPLNQFSISLCSPVAAESALRC